LRDQRVLIGEHLPQDRGAPQACVEGAFREALIQLLECARE
jgi:hypothetical protein